MASALYNEEPKDWVVFIIYAGKRVKLFIILPHHLKMLTNEGTTVS
jgi:hypothetical protein